MLFDGDVLTIEAELSLDEIREFEQFVRSRIDYIETIEIDMEKPLQSSALLAILISLKRTRPDLKIPLIDNGKTTSEVYGTLHWMSHD
jgi:hypothetical protein